MFVFIKMNYSCNDTFRDRKIDNIEYMLKDGFSENTVLNGKETDKRLETQFY